SIRVTGEVTVPLSSAQKRPVWNAPLRPAPSMLTALPLSGFASPGTFTVPSSTVNLLVAGSTFGAAGATDWISPPMMPDDDTFAGGSRAGDRLSAKSLKTRRPPPAGSGVNVVVV